MHIPTWDMNEDGSGTLLFNLIQLGMCQTLLWVMIFSGFPIDVIWWY